MIKKTTTYKFKTNILSKEKLINIYDYLKDKYDVINFDIIDNIIIYDSYDKNIIKLNELGFIHEIFIKYYEKHCDKLQIIKINNETINIAYESCYITNNMLDNIRFHIINIIKIFNKNFNKNKIYNFILSPFQKTYTYKSLEIYKDQYPWIQQYINNNDDGISAFNINSGVSIGSEIIYVYRMDELFKVLFHECIHNFGLDFQREDKYICSHQPSNSSIVLEDSHSKTNNLCSNMYIGTNKYPILINEAYTEYIGLLMWNYYLCNYEYYYNKNPHNLTDIKQLYCHMLQREYDNSVLQCYKYLKYHNINDLTIFLNPNNLKQYTNAFSYIFLKFVLFNNLSLPQTDIYNYLISEFIINKLNNYNFLLSLSDDNSNLLQLSIYKLVF